MEYVFRPLSIQNSFWNSAFFWQGYMSGGIGLSQGLHPQRATQNVAENNFNTVLIIIIFINICYTFINDKVRLRLY
jgi:hypothetical protein